MTRYSCRYLFCNETDLLQCGKSPINTKRVYLVLFPLTLNLSSVLVQREANLRYPLDCEINGH